jgi:hypothetical protein
MTAISARACDESKGDQHRPGGNQESHNWCAGSRSPLKQCKAKRDEQKPNANQHSRHNRDANTFVANESRRFRTQESAIFLASSSRNAKVVLFI